MKKDWQIKDILDLEYFFHQDATDQTDALSAADLARRDRDIYLSRIEPELSEDRRLSRRAVIRSWLTCRRTLEKKTLPPDTPLPGEVYGETYQILTWAFVIIGLLTGAGLASSFMTYTGAAPLNVAYYFGGLILSQFLLMLILLAALCIRVVNRSFAGRSILYSLLSGLLVKLAGWARKKTMKTFSGSQRTGVEAALGLLKGRRKVYGSLFYWPIFILAQVFGVFFNIGIMTATLVKVLFSDIAFGWQSTVQFGPDVVYNLVQTIAAPWSFFVPKGIAYPSLAEIEGSRMVLKEGIYFLATKDLIAWWPFLLFAVVFYGLIPRLILLFCGLIAKNRALARLDFEFSDCDRLTHRLENPLVSTEGTPTSGLSPGSETVPSAVPPAFDLADVPADRRLVALVPEDIHEQCDEAALRSAATTALGDQVTEILRIGEGYEGDRAVLDDLSTKDREPNRPRILLIQEGWQPPIRETLTFLKNLRETVGQRTGIIVGLIGKPRPDTIFTPVGDIDWNVWQQKISGLGDPYLRLEKLCGS